MVKDKRQKSQDKSNFREKVWLKTKDKSQKGEVKIDNGNCILCFFIFEPLLSRTLTKRDLVGFLLNFYLVSFVFYLSLCHAFAPSVTSREVPNKPIQSVFAAFSDSSENDCGYLKHHSPDETE